MDGEVSIEPSDPHVDTDADSRDEDMGSGRVSYLFYFLLIKHFIHQIISICSLGDNLNSRQLLSNAEIRILPNNDRICIDYDVLHLDHRNITLGPILCDTSSDIRPTQLPDKYEKWMDTRMKSKSKPRWIEGADFDVENACTFLEPDFSSYQNMSIIEIFEKFIDDEIIEHLVVETRKYALFLNCPDPNNTSDEIRCFF